jgi:hypothetical protein
MEPTIIYSIKEEYFNLIFSNSQDHIVFIDDFVLQILYAINC